MRKRSIHSLLNIALVLLGFSACASQAASFIDPDTHWQSLHSEHFVVHYHDEVAMLAEHVARQAEAAHELLTPIFGWTPEQKTQILLTDRYDYANGSADIIPRNSMTLHVTPPDSLVQLADYDDWLERLLIHEYAHVLHLDAVYGRPSRWRSVIGRLFFLFPNKLQPQWVIEGLATYLETDSQQAVGRGQSNLFKAYMRIEVDAGVKPLSQVSLNFTDWPQGTAAYLYGVYFFNFLRDSYGEESIQRWVRNYSDNLLPFAMNSNTRQSFEGKDLHQLWEEYTEYLQQQFQPQIQAIKDAGADRSQRLSHDGYYTGYPQLTPNGDVYYLRDDALLDSQLMRLRAGTAVPEVVGRVRGGNFDVHPEAGIVVAQLDYTNSTNRFYDIYHLDPDSGQIKQLSSGARYHYAAWMPDGKQLIGVHNQAGNKALHLLNSSGELLETLWQGNNKEAIGQPHVAADGQQLVAAVWRPGTQWNIEEFSLASKQWRRLTHNTDIESSPRYTTDGKAVIFSADYDGVFNLYRLDLASGELQRLSNLLGGAFSVSSPAIDGSLYFTGLHSSGYDLYRLGADAQLQQTVTMPNSQSPDYPLALPELSEPRISDYSPQVLPTAWYPGYSSDDSRNTLSFYTFGSDLLRRHSYNLGLHYDATNDWVTGEFDYLYDRWNPSIKLYLDREVLRYVDSRGATAVYRNDDRLNLEFIWPFIRYEQQMGLHLGWLHNRESDKQVVIAGASRPDRSSELLGMGVSYNSARQHSRGISLNEGQRWRLNLEDYDSIDSVYSGQVYSLDWSAYLPMGTTHVLHTRAVFGWGSDQPKPFRLGGYSDNRSVSHPLNTYNEFTSNNFNRRSYALKGYPEGLASLQGRRMFLAELEWRFPIATIERTAITPPLGANRLHGRMFYSLGDAWDDNAEADDLRDSVGAELYGGFKLGYHFDISLRVGYAYGLDEGGEGQSYLQVAFPFEGLF